ncbi:vanadium-dependent haloperoxidase [Kribbella sancticallisti]|uniref:Vanadium-dependent haloperoxidase n=1 Tax=Kribbella sancticallisti TaxID=460087 RepID=A0ABP4QCE4_9ACTN
MSAGSAVATKPEPVSAAPVLDWSRWAAQAIVVGRPPASSEVLIGIVHVAIADTVAGLGHGRPFLVDVRDDRLASARAAVATAAYDVLRARVPGQQTFLDATYGEYLAAVRDGDAKTRGVRLGQKVAAAVLAWRANDGMANQVPYVQPPAGPGVWEPTAVTPPVDIVLTQVKPLVLRSSTQFRPAGPDPLTSRRYARDVAEVAAVGRVDSAVRTEKQTETVRFWTDNAAQWTRALTALAETRQLSIGAAARMLLRVHVSAADSLITCWAAKFHFTSWRPVHAIQRGDTDGNPRTGTDPTWSPLLAANHPEYPSGHSCFTNAVTTALQSYFHTDRVRLVISSTVTGTTRSYDRLSDVGADVREARILSGLHFRHAMLDGEVLGRGVSHWVADHLRAAR